MNFSLTLLLLVSTTAVFTAAINCRKMIRDQEGSIETMKATNDIMEKGQYMVRTIRRTDSAELQELISTLDGASDIHYKQNSFTAVLQPKDLKKLCHSDHLVRSIKEVKMMKNFHNCNKLRRGNPKFVIPTSYIVMIKQHYDMSEMAPLTLTASNNLDSSVMIASVQEFYNPNRRGATMRMNTDGLNYMCNQSIVDYIEEDQEVSMASSTLLWHLDRINQHNLPLDEEYTTPTSNGSGVDIYVFDTGIKYDHDEFEGRAKYDLYDPLDTIGNSNQQGLDCHGHGTHVAALVAGKTYGVAKGATVYSMRVLSCSGSGSFVNVLLGINHVIEQQIANRDRRIIISMSLLGPLSRAVDDAIEVATNEGILVVVAAGNGFTDACRFSPGASSYALTVGGTQQNDDLYLRPFDGTNYGKCVDIFAPGQDILSAGIRGNTDEATMSGTSQATPLVSGAAAVHWNMNRDATPLQIKDTITSTCTHNKLTINAVVPSSFAEQSPNCLLYIEDKLASTHTTNDSNSAYRIFHSVPSSEVANYIKDMENNSYALTYINSHLIKSSVHYSLIFKYMGDVEFKTMMFEKLKKLKRTVASYEANGYQMTLIHHMMNDIEHIVVLEKTNLTYSHEFRLTKENHESLYQTRSQNESLLSTTVAIIRKSELRYTSIYVHNNAETHHLSSVNTSELLAVLDNESNQGFHLTHLTIIPTNPPSYAVVFHKMTKRPKNYVMTKNLKLGKVENFVQKQVSKGLTPLVVAGLNTPNGIKFVTTFEQ